MNQLSWAIYLADVIESAKVALGILIFIFFINGFALTLFALGVFDHKFKSNKRHFFHLAHLFWIFLTIIQILTPTKDTFQMIVASEFAEQGIEKFIELSQDEKSIVNKGLKKIESMLEVDK